MNFPIQYVNIKYIVPIRIGNNSWIGETKQSNPYNSDLSNPLLTKLATKLAVTTWNLKIIFNAFLYTLFAKPNHWISIV